MSSSLPLAFMTKLCVLVTMAWRVAAISNIDVQGMTQETEANDALSVDVQEEANASAIAMVSDAEEEVEGGGNSWYFDGRQNINTQMSTCNNFKAFIKQHAAASVLTMRSNLGAKVVCKDRNIVKQLVANLIAQKSGRMQYTCNGKVWRTGSCGSGTEICAGCSSICTCNSGFSFRPCIVNYNWGGSGTTCNAASQRLFMEIGGGLLMRDSYAGTRGQSSTSGMCTELRNKMAALPNPAYADLTLRSSTGASYTCNDHNKVNNLLQRMRNNQAHKEYCNGRWWKVGGCGSYISEISVGNSNTCQCSNDITFRPCIVNSNWGGAGKTCGANSQTLTMEVGSGAKKTTTTTTTSTSTTTTTTTAVKVTMKTFMLPEASSWKITSGKKTVCAGKGYTDWYSSIKVDCKLVYKRRYRITCTNPKIGGWAGGYLEVKGKKLCQKYEWSQGSNFNEYFTAR